VQAARNAPDTPFHSNGVTHNPASIPMKPHALSLLLVAAIVVGIG
jgi:hypothetical protein